MDTNGNNGAIRAKWQLMFELPDHTEWTYYTCSHCGTAACEDIEEERLFGTVRYSYCPHCGARMED